MRHSETSQTADAGKFAVMRKFVEIGWRPIEVPQGQDIGTDLIISVVDGRTFDLGIFIGAQVKSGASFFSTPTKECDGWFHETDAEHADYWASHRLPHFLVLFDPASQSAYWNHINPKTAKSTGKGFKIFVPKAQVIEFGQLDALLGIAVSTTDQPTQGGKAFNASANSVAPLARMRTALLSPRLLAPHGNRGRVDVLEPEEALALVAQAKVMEFNWQMEDRNFWKSLDEKPTNKDWRWHFTHALWIALTQSKLELLEAALQTADRKDWRAAALSSLVARYFEHSRLAEAKTLLDAEIALDKAEPTDHAWLLLHRSRIRAELGEIEGALADAKFAQNSLAKRSDDVTAMLLFSVALRTQYGLRPFGDRAEGDLAQLINSGDNPASWWDSQQISWALESAAEDQFKVWAGDTAQQLNNDPTGNQLLAPKLLAGFAANQSAWRHATMRHARYAIQNAKTSAEIGFQLEQLLRAGAKDELKLACTRFFQDGPSHAIADLLKRCVPENYSHSVWHSMVSLWQEFGELANDESADAVIRWAIAQFEPDAGVELKRLNQDLRSARSSLRDMLKGAMTTASDLVHTEIADLVLGEKLNTVTDQQSRAQMLDAVRPGAMNTEQDVMLLALLDTEIDETFKTSVFRAALKRKVPQAELRALTAMRNGDWYLYSRIIDLVEPDAPTFAPIVLAISNGIKADQATNATQRFGIGGVDKVGLLTFINLACPEAADWRTVIDVLLDSNVNAEKKSGSCMQIAQAATKVPGEISRELVAGGQNIADSKYLPKNWFSGSVAREAATDIANLIHCTLADVREGEFDDTLAELMAADAKHITRALQLLYLKPHEKHEAFIFSCLRHEDFAVRVNAASTLGKYVSATLLTPVVRKGVLLIADHHGVQIPLAFLKALGKEVHQMILEPAIKLGAHPSCRVRALAQSLWPHLIESRKAAVVGGV